MCLITLSIYGNVRGWHRLGKDTSRSDTIQIVLNTWQELTACAAYTCNGYDI
jgi:hypothetical protein